MKVYLKKKEENRILGGHQWLFSNQIDHIEGNPENGDIVNICKNNNEFFGQGFFNKNSLITLRFLTYSDRKIDKDFFKTRISSAFNLRKKLYSDSNIYKLVFSESDFLPGLIIDRFDDQFSIQTFCAGMEKHIEIIKEILIEMFEPEVIIEKNEAQIRTLEGLELRTSVLYGTTSIKIMEMDNIKYNIDLLNGQKTGFFLDQRENRKAIRRFVKDKTVLDCFCNEGGFALNAAFGNAKSVHGLEISKTIMEKAIENSKLNNFNCTFEKIDVFDKLEEYSREGIKFDVVILDPPSFTKSKQNIPTAIKAYKRINSLAMKIMTDEGILITSSCSHHITEETFYYILKECAQKTKVNLKLLESHSAAPDHPILLSMPETKYLKFAIFQVTN